MKKIHLLLSAALLMTLPVFLQASTYKGGEKVTIDEPVDQNLYVAGGEVRINAPISGDLLAAGGKIWVNSAVMDECLAVGGDLIFDAEIKGDLRIGGGNITVNKNVLGDLVVAGGEVRIGPDVTIGGDLIIFGGKAHLEGVVSGKISVFGGEFTLDGKANGELHTRCGQVVINGEVRGPAELSTKNLSLGDNAQFLAPVRYWQEAGEIDFGKHLQEGATASFTPDLKNEFKQFDREKWRRGWFLFSIYRFVAGIVLITLLVLFFHRFFNRHAGKMTENVAASLGYGVLYLIGVPVLAILTFVTVIGIPVGFILSAGYGISLAMAGALLATVLAYELNKTLGRKWDKGTILLVAVGFSLLIRLLQYIPVAGGLISLLLIIVMFGYLYQNIQAERKMRRQDDIV